jgi:hypothetical protein
MRPRLPRMKLESARRGQALVITVVFLVLLAGLVLSFTSLAASTTSQVTAQRAGDELINAARTGLAQSQHEVWEEYIEDNGGEAGSADDLRDWLDLLGATDADSSDDEPGVRAFLADMNLNPGAVHGRLQSVTVERTVQRQDDGPHSTFIILTAVAYDSTDPNGTRRTAEVVLRAGGQPFEGFRYGLLANNINCIFCHAHFNSVENFYNLAGGDPVARVKVASLETLLVRDGSDSTIAGTLYVQGPITNKSGTVLTADDLTATSIGGAGGLEALDIDADGNILDPEAIVGFNFEGNDQQFANFYKDYPTDPDLQVDGALPSEFPPVIPDSDGDKSVDDDEWDSRVGSMNGTLSGGTITTVADGDTYSGSMLPAGGGGSLASDTPNTNVILVGTKDNPIVIDGEVAVDGDIVISGYVQGTDGVLIARNNLYVVGDIIYADGDTNGDGTGDRTYGVTNGGDTNAVAFGAGGNIIHGNYNTDKGGNLIDGDALSGGGFTMSELSLFNRGEWTKTQPFFDPSTGLVTDVDTGVANSGYEGADYIPRYYVLEPGDAVANFAPEGTVEWNNELGSWQGKEHGSSFSEIDLSGQTQGVDYQLAPLNPNNNWISQTDLQTIFSNEDGARTPGPYEIDGLLYTNNAIVILDRKASSGGGQMIVNGAIISADAGILIPGNNGKGPPEWDENKSSSSFDEAKYGFDINGDGDTNDTLSMQDIYDNRAIWPLNSTEKWDGHITAPNSKGKSNLDLNMDGDYGDKVSAPPPGGQALDGGLFLNYDENAARLLQLEDPTQVELFTVSRREQ